MRDRSQARCVLVQPQVATVLVLLPSSDGMDSSADIDGIDVPKSVEYASKRRSPNERYDDRCRSCKERLRDCHLGRSGEGVQATPCESTQIGVVLCQTERCHRASRSLRLGSLLGKDVPKVGTRRRPAPTSPREALSTREQERPRRHEGVARGLQERGASSRTHQVRAPAHPRRAPSPALRMALHTDPHASMPYAGSCANSDSSSQRALTSSCPPSSNSSKTLILICPTCSVRISVMPVRDSRTQGQVR